MEKNCKQNHSPEALEPFLENGKAVLVKKGKLAENGEYNLTGERYKTIQIQRHEKWQMVRLGDVCETLDSFRKRNIFSNIEYSIQIGQEKYYQTIFYLIFHVLGVYIRTEVYTNVDRIDAVIEGSSIYIFEFKLTGSKEDTISQIKKQRY